VNTNQERARKTAELMAAWSDADGIFTTLSDVLAGTTLNDRSQLEVKIGSGGFAAVYRGVDLKEGRPVAVKVLRPQPGVDANRQRQQFRQEGVSAARLTHPNAVVVLDSGVTSVGLAFLVMELLQGRSLADEMREEGRLTPTRCAEILPAICDALATAHAAGIIHRDIKPANIFLHRGPDGEIVKVVDFGIAKLEDPAELDNATTAGRVLGTPVYMSPERLMGQPYDGRADVYGVGMVLYEALAGRMPFDIRENEGLGSLIWTCIWAPPLPLRHVNPTIPAPVAAVVMRAISKQPEARPAMADLANEFSRALLAGEAPAQLEPTLDRPIKPR
jgi:serine/threonine protein kinase